MNCSRCSDPELRRSWGCNDELSDTEWLNLENQNGFSFEFPCLACDGNGAEDCRSCEGSGKWKPRRCPWATIEAWHYQTVEAVVLRNAGHLPMSGGWWDHPALLVVGARYVQAEANRIEEARLPKGDDMTGGRR